MQINMLDEPGYMLGKESAARSLVSRLMKLCLIHLDESESSQTSFR